MDPDRKGQSVLLGHPRARRRFIRSLVERLSPRIRWELEVWEKLHVAPADLFVRLTARLAALIAETFAVEEDEVAILLLRDGGVMLRFAHPIPLSCEPTNVFPVCAASIAGEVLRRRAGRVDNGVPRIPHLDFYERLCRPPRRPWEIQKMVSTPLWVPEGDLLGVVQVSRKGDSGESAGPNFSVRDLVTLADLSRWLTPHLRRAIPPDF